MTFTFVLKDRRVMIDHHYRAIFIHQRKVAGMAVARAWGFKKHHVETLGNNFHRYNDGVLSWDWDKRTPLERSYFVFSAVRNPFDRIISSWKFLESTRHRPLEEVLENPPRETRDYEHFTRPQISILREPGAKDLVTNDLMRYETLQQDFDRICERIGRPRMLLQHVNTSEREPGYHQYFNARSRKLAENLFAEDLEVFVYKF